MTAATEAANHGNVGGSERARSQHRSLTLQESLWNLAKELVESLEQVASVTTLLSGQNYCTFSLLVPISAFSGGWEGASEDQAVSIVVTRFHEILAREAWLKFWLVILVSR